MTSIPELEPHCGSWMIVNRSTKKPVIELFERHTVEHINQEKYEVVTMLQWLVRVNEAIKNNETWIYCS